MRRGRTIVLAMFCAMLASAAWADEILVIGDHVVQPLTMPFGVGAIENSAPAVARAERSPSSPAQIYVVTGSSGDARFVVHPVGNSGRPVMVRVRVVPRGEAPELGRLRNPFDQYMWRDPAAADDVDLEHRLGDVPLPRIPPDAG